jgi:hypothetical protein
LISSYFGLGEDSDDMGDWDEGNIASKFFPEVGENFEEEIHYKSGVNYKEMHVTLFKEDIGVESIDGGDPMIYSDIEAVGPYSFVDIRQDYDLACPPPTYLAFEDVHEKLPIEKEEIFEKFEFCKSGGLRCTDEEAMERQKGVLKDVVKEFAKNFIKGLGISHMSLPVRMFEPRSTIQRVADYFWFAPIFIKRAAQSTSIIDRFKYAVWYFISGMQVCTGQLKPFNPILGETMQAKIPDGSNVYWEHISHHPPITTYSLEDVDKEYLVWGSSEFTANLGGNSMKAGQEGNNYIKFKDGQTIRITVCHYTLGGTVIGDRTLNADGHFYLDDIENNLRCVLIFNPIMKAGGVFSSHKYAGKTDEFRGMLYTPKSSAKYDKSKKYTKYKHMEEEAKEVHSEFKGSWLSNLTIDNEEWWSIDDPDQRPLRPIPNRTSLPSDWRYREDLIFLYRNNMRSADKWKVRLEVQQRLDRKNRTDIAKKRKKGRKFIAIN